jgi:hypothetical protein
MRVSDGRPNSLLNDMSCIFRIMRDPSVYVLLDTLRVHAEFFETREKFSGDGSFALRANLCPRMTIHGLPMAKD